MISVVSRRALARAALSISTAVLVLATGAPVAAQDPAPVPPPPAPTDIRHRGELFGDWGGARTKLGEKQTKIDVSYTQFFDWVPVGDDNRGFDYGGKIDVIGRSQSEQIPLGRVFSRRSLRNALR